METTGMAKEKTILVTGGCGFIGSNFVRYIISERPEWTILNLDALTYAGNPMNLSDLEEKAGERYRFVRGDIRERKLLDNLFAENRFDGVFHFAAESHVDRSILGPEAFVETNVMGTFRVLDAARASWEQRGRPEDFRFLHVSTDEVYGSLGETGCFREDTPYDPSSPYSASKAASDHFVNAYLRTYGLPTLVTNCSNNYGPYQFPEKLIPLMILNIMEEKPLPVYGDGKNVRDWLYVTDHCEALVEVFEKGRPGETYNIGGGTELENIGIVHRLCDLMDERLKFSGSRSSRRLIHFVKDRPGS
jgi:dTDP-glucose 4,6-dehydratase